MQTRSGVVLRYEGRKRNAAFKTTCGSSPALRYDNGAYSRLQFLQAVSHSLGAHTEAFQARPKTTATGTLMLVATSQSSTQLRLPLLPPPSPLSLHPMTCARCALSNLATGQRWYIMWAFSILLQLCGCRCVYTQWMLNLHNANRKRSARVHVTIRITDIEQHNSTTVTLTIAVFSGS